MANTSTLSHADFITAYKNAKSLEKLIEKTKMDKKQISARISVLRGGKIKLNIKTLAQRWPNEVTGGIDVEALKAMVDGDILASEEQMPTKRNKVK